MSTKTLYAVTPVSSVEAVQVKSTLVAVSLDALNTALNEVETGGTGLWRQGVGFVYPSNADNIVITDKKSLKFFVQDIFDPE